MTAIICLLVSTALSMSGASIHTSVQVHSYLPKFMVTTLHDKLLLYRLKWIFLVVVPCDRNLLTRNTFFWWSVFYAFCKVITFALRQWDGKIGLTSTLEWSEEEPPTLLDFWQLLELAPTLRLFGEGLF